MPELIRCIHLFINVGYDCLKYSCMEIKMSSLKTNNIKLYHLMLSESGDVYSSSRTINFIFLKKETLNV